ncbi:VanZ family protein [Paenibacillus sp. MMO-177]|uniref:VanZ family protein n=1 Tax=Paenibacillus sp. MMO-177 TaxID=3081289 RepID=UPI003019DBB1
MRLGFDILIVAVPATLLYIIIRIGLWKVFRINLIREVLHVSFVLYASSVVFMVWLYYAAQTEYILYNYIPFKTIIEYLQDIPSSTAIRNIIGNIVICMPFGFYYFFKIRVIPKINIAVYAVAIPLIIESGQLIMYFINLGMRAVDIDDVILNSSGILLGYYITRSLFQKKKGSARSTHIVFNEK